MSGEAYTLPSEFNQVKEKESVENIEEAITTIDSIRSLKLNIDSEIKLLCRKLNKEEYDLLKRDIEEHGCTDSILYWEGHDIIIDGHNRYEICNEIGKLYNCIPMAFDTKDDVMNYVIDHQLARRNLSDMERSYLRGKRYLTEKKAPHRPKTFELHQDDGVIGETAQRIAKKSGASKATIERDAIVAESIDKLRNGVGDDFSRKLLNKEIKLPKKDIIELSKKSPDDMKPIVALIEKGNKLSDAERIVRSQNVSSNPTDETESEKREGDLKKVEKHLEEILRILENIGFVTKSDKLAELSAKAQKISDRLKEIGAMNPDSPSQVDISATNSQRVEIEEEPNEAISKQSESEDDDKSNELVDDETEFEEDNSSDHDEFLEDFPEFYQDAIDGENEGECFNE